MHKCYIMYYIHIPMYYEHLYENLYEHLYEQLQAHLWVMTPLLRGRHRNITVFVKVFIHRCLCSRS